MCVNLCWIQSTPLVSGAGCAAAAAGGGAHAPSLLELPARRQAQRPRPGQEGGAVAAAEQR